MATVTVVPFPAGSPCPYVDVLVNGAPAGAASVTVWRTHEGRKFKVRGMVRMSVIDAMTQRDWEAPFDVNLTYQAQFYATTDPRDESTVGYSDPATVRLASLVPFTGWFHDPLDPETAVRVSFLASAAKELSKSVPAQTLKILNRSVGVIIGGTRNGVENIALDCATLTADETARFDHLFGDYDQVSTAIVCVRADSAMPLPRLLMASIPQPKQQQHNARSGGTVTGWVLSGTEVAPPAPAIIKALLTYQDFEDFYATYAEFEAAYTSYQQAARDYSVKGA